MISALCFLALQRPITIIDWRKLEPGSAAERKVRAEVDRLMTPGPYPRQGSLVAPFEVARQQVMAKPDDNLALLRATLLYGYAGADGALIRVPRFQVDGDILQLAWNRRKNVRSFELARAYMLFQSQVYGSDRFANTDHWIRLTEFAEDPWLVSRRCNSRVWAGNRATDRAYQRSKRDYLFKVPFCQFLFRHSVLAINVSDAADRKDKAQMSLAIRQARALMPMVPPNHPYFHVSSLEKQVVGLEKLIKKW